MFSLKIGEEAGMGAFAFVAALVQSLAWPVAIVIIVWMMRDRLGNALSRLAEISFPGGGIKFGEKLEELKETSEEVIAAQSEEFKAGIGSNSPAQPEIGSEESPEAVVLIRFRDLERDVVRVAREFDIPTDKKQPFAIVQELLRRQIIDESTYVLFREIRALRNDVAHAEARNLTRSQAQEYARQCDLFLYALNFGLEVRRKSTT